MTQPNLDPDDPTPRVVREIENNLLLKQMLSRVEDIAKQQEANHLVSSALIEHRTIEHTDTLWNSINFLLKLVVVLITGLSLVGGVLLTTHSLWGWP